MDYKIFDSQNHVYLVGNKKLNYYKVGVAVNIQKRINGLSSPFEVELMAHIALKNRFQALDVEAGLHRLYLKKNIRGEWFRDLNPKTFVDDAETVATGLLKRWGRR